MEERIQTRSRGIYPSDFVCKVKRAYPNSPVLHDLLDRNSLKVGKVLDDAMCEGVHPQHVIDACDSGLDGLINLRKEAERMLRAHHLYDEWCAITCSWAITP